MQLKRGKGKSARLIANASLTLLCATPQIAAAQDAGTEPPKGGEPASTEEAVESRWVKSWSGEVGFLGYSETKGRVTALEPAIKLNAEFEGDRVWSTKLVYDSLTGASPNGALNNSQPQTFTSPSGSGTYTIAPGTQPLFNQFKDNRFSLTSSWTAPFRRLWKYSVGLNVSKEYDYLSMGANASLSKDSEDKNQTWTTGLSYTKDSIEPVGGTPIPGATMAAPAATQPKKAGANDKKTVDFLFGFTQVIARDWIMQANVSLGYSSGYMNDPYKFVTIFDETTGNPSSYIYESRPDSRFKKSIYLASKNDWTAGVSTLSYRFLTDDWGVSSHTLEGSFNFALSESWRLEPGMRYYVQNAADFYRLAVGQTETRPANVTADYRMGDLTTTSPALKIIHPLDDGKEISLILRYYRQTSDTSSFRPVGSQVGQDLAPSTDAYVVQAHYSF